MVLRSMGAATLARLMRPEREDDWPGSDWLLFGPEDPQVIEPAQPAPPMLLAAE
jgi:hypothetical protein